MKKAPLIRILTAVLLAAAAASLAACAYHSQFIEVRQDNPAPLPRVWKIRGIAVEQSVPDRELEARIPEVLSLIGATQGVTVLAAGAEEAASGEPFALLDLWVKEKSYTRGLDQYNSITAFLTLIAPDGKEILARAVYSEDTEESIKSFQRLYIILNELVGAMGARAAR